MLHLNSQDVRQLLHNKFVVILGDSIQRSVYKDLIQLLQSDSLLTTSQMKSKGEYTFENDHLIEGGVLDGLHNGIGYREVRQYRTRYHLVRFYFLTRIHSKYFESILEDFRVGLQPDVLILNSCVWDVSRYGSSSMKEYRKNLEIAFNRLDADLPPSCLVIWNMTMPLGPSIKGGFLIPELQHLSQTLRQDIIEGNFYGATLANLHLFDVVDLHFHFRFDLGNRVKDGIHWNNVVHRRITNLLLTHLADAWGVVIPKKNPCGGQVTFADRFEADWHYPRHPSFCDDFLFVPNDEGSPMPFSGFFSFEEPQGLPFCPDNVFRDVALDNFHCHPWDPPQPFLPYPSHNEENIIPRSRRHRRRKHAGTPFVMRQGPSYRRDVSPYRKRKVPFNRH